MKWNATFKNFSVTLVVIVLTLLLCELAIRVVYGDKYGKRPGFFISDDMMGYKPAPGLDHNFYGPDYKLAIRTDDEGYRLGELGDVDFDKDLIVLCGDSYAFGWGVSTGETFASYLDGKIDKASQGGARLVNLGVAGYGTWQYAHRLEDFTMRFPNAKIKAVIFLHVSNDAVDNLMSIGYPLGILKTRDADVGSRSRLHLLNMISYLTGALRSNEDKAGSDSLAAEEKLSDEEMHELASELQDILFAYEHTTERSAPLPASVDFQGRKVVFEGVSSEDYSQIRTMKREAMTRIQRDLMREAISYGHFIIQKRGAKIFHMILPTVSSWYEAEMLEMYRTVEPSPGNDLVFIGRYPDPGRYADKIYNDHSGGHFTPEFNEYWAAWVFEFIDNNGAGIRSGR